MAPAPADRHHGLGMQLSHWRTCLHGLPGCQDAAAFCC
jgi:hypothetical protein